MKKDNLYKTTSFYIATWLLMNNIVLKSVDWNSSTNRAEFAFEDFEGSDALIKDFFKQDILQKFIYNSQQLKSRMYAARGTNV
jgi:hypothetical protein